MDQCKGSFLISLSLDVNFSCLFDLHCSLDKHDLGSNIVGHRTTVIAEVSAAEGTIPCFRLHARPPGKDGHIWQVWKLVFRHAADADIPWNSRHTVRAGCLFMLLKRDAALACTWSSCNARSTWRSCHAGPSDWRWHSHMRSELIFFFFFCLERLRKSWCGDRSHVARLLVH